MLNKNRDWKTNWRLHTSQTVHFSSGQRLIINMASAIQPSSSSSSSSSTRRHHHQELMASPRQLPDRPQPYSVLTEHWQDKLRFPETEADNTDDICSFGDVYEDNLYKLIHKHLELDTHDRFAYVGASKGKTSDNGYTYLSSYYTQFSVVCMHDL